MNFAPISRFASRNALRIKRNSPQILFYAGIAGTVATTVLASRATLKAVPVVEKFNKERDELDYFHLEDAIDPDVYTHEVYKSYATVSVELTKLYAPAVVVGVVSLAALTKSHRQLANRNTALTVAYTGLSKTFNAYRERVREQLGDEKDQQFLHGTVQQEIEYKDKQGKTRTKSITALDPSSTAALSYYFDRSNPAWVSDPGYNQNFLDGTQRWANLQLQKNGHLFLNEVYDMLKIPHTRDAAILGWVFEDLGYNDTFVTFNHTNDGDFMGGFKPDVMLEFNIHGPILELI